MIKHEVKKIILRLANVRYVGRLVRTAAAVWRAPQTRSLSESTNHRSIGTANKLEAISEGYGAAIRGLEKCTRRHEISFGTLKNQFDEKLSKQSKQLEELNDRLKWISIDHDNLRSRLEFIRKETMFEVRKGLHITTPNATSNNQVQGKVLNPEKCNAPGDKKLNLGCGHIPLAEFINVDARELPNVDIVADVSKLPFEANTINEIRAAHLIEHFSERTLKDILLPHWLNIMVPGGKIVLITPDAGAMIEGYIRHEYAFETLREVIFGGQEYDGDFHFTMLTPESAKILLKEVGFNNIDIVESARKNGECYEFEIHAEK